MSWKKKPKPNAVGGLYHSCFSLPWHINASPGNLFSTGIFKHTSEYFLKVTRKKKNHLKINIVPFFFSHILQCYSKPMPQKTSPCKTISGWMSRGRPWATHQCHPGAAAWRINNARLARNYVQLLSRVWEKIWFIFYCKWRPSRLHIKRLNSSRLYSHTQRAACVS